MDTPAWEKELSYHLLIWNHPTFLNFLEADVADIPFIRKEWARLDQDEDFVDFVSPYFAGSFNNLMRSYLDSVDFDEAITWINYLKFVRPQDYDSAMVSTMNFLEESIQLFKSIELTTYEVSKPLLKPWTDTSWYLFINNLPVNLQAYKDELAELILDFTIKLYSVDLTVAYMLSVRLSQLQGLNFSRKDIIQKNHENLSAQYSGPVGTIEESGSSRSSAWNLLWGAIVVVKIIILIAKCS
ncbi:hypothetical protein [Dysgonomonas sp. 25]|uniref:hypothetical protein n=1 Tax=Dysgonomonas sp. 25 TaxID=2302933 RepID=UPI0013D0118C|nr:hypothetical protein [Dysgonomonas sp. 25]